MTDHKPTENEGEETLAEVTSIFDAFEPPPDIDPNRFGPVPIVGEDEEALDGVDSDGAAGVTVDDDVLMIDGAPFSLGKAHSAPVAGDDGSVEDLLPVDELIELDEPIELDQPIDLTKDDEEILVETWGDALTEADGDTMRVADVLPLSADEPQSKSTDLPHWTEPATGQVPPVVSNGEDGAEVWQDLNGPRWKGEGPDWAEDDIADVLAGDDSEELGEPLVRIDDDDLADAAPSAVGTREAPVRPGLARPKAPAAEPGERNIPVAIGVGLALAAVALAAFRLSGNLWALGLITVVAVLASVEVFDAMRRAGLHPATLLGITAAVSLPLATYSRGEAAFPLLLGLTVVFGALWYIVGADTHRPALNLGLTFLGIGWVGGLASFAALILLLPDGKSMLVAAIIVTVASDTFALAGGKAFGSRPFHSASPNKTWEGTVVGFVAAVAAGAVVALLDISPFSIEFTDAVYLGIVGGLLAPLGDLTESMIKRDLGVKDMGQLLPGHGGVLDRLDGLLFVLPGTYYLALVLGLT